MHLLRKHMCCLRAVAAKSSSRRGPLGSDAGTALACPPQDAIVVAQT